MKNTMTDMRNHIFATIEGVLDPDNPLALDKARVVVSAAQTLINSAKVEVEFLGLFEEELRSQFLTVGSPFFAKKEPELPTLPPAKFVPNRSR